MNPKEAEQLFTQVLQEFGVLLDFKVINSKEPPNFTWGIVQLPSHYLEKPASIVKQVLRHEVGHRVIFPGKPDWEKLTMVLAARKGVTDTESFANVVADLIVDYELLKKYGQEYYERIVEAGNGYRGKDPRFWFMLSTYQLMAENLKLKTPDFIEKAKKYSIKPDELVVPKAKKTIEILKSNASLEGKIEQLAELLKDLFHAMFRRSFDDKIRAHGGLPNLSKLGPVIPAPEFMVQNDERNPIRDPQWLSRMIALLAMKHTQCPDPSLCKPSSSPSYLMQLGVGFTGSIFFMESEVMVEAARLSLYARYVEALERIGASGTKVEELEQWTLGDLPYELRVEETMRIYGDVLPPVFSLKFSTKEEPSSGGKAGSVIIVIDVSGSMGGLKLERAKEAAFSILQEARRRGDEVKLVFFNGEALALPEGRDYDIYEKAVAGVLASGGTVLPRALEHAVEYATKVGRATTFVITDAETGEVGYSIKLMNELSRYGKTVVFWITSSPTRIAEDLLKNVEAKVYMVPPGQPFAEEALREAQW